MTKENIKQWIDNGPQEAKPLTEEEKKIMEEFFEEEIQHAMDIIADLVPYDTPNYDEVLRRMAEQYVREINDPNSELNRAVRWNDKFDGLEHYVEIDFGKFLKDGGGLACHNQ